MCYTLSYKMIDIILLSIYGYFPFSQSKKIEQAAEMSREEKKKLL